MKKTALLAILVFHFLGHPLAQSDSQSSVLSIRFENLETTDGQIQVALYDSEESFMNTEKAKLYSFKVNQESAMVCEIRGLLPGTYALATFHDEDGNDMLNTNFFGIPKEPYGFSRQCPSKWRPPTFAEAKISIVPGNNELKIPLQRWKF